MTFNDGDRARTCRLAHGQMGGAHAADHFRGRRDALALLESWFAADSHGAPAVVTGAPGAGSSAVLLRAALAAETRTSSPGLVFAARGARTRSLVDAVAAVCGVAPAPSWQSLVRGLRRRGVATSGETLVVVDDVDEAATPADVAAMRRFVHELARTDGVRVAVAMTRAPHGDHAGRDADVADTLDLDAEPFADPDAVVEHVACVLAQLGREVESPGAWRTYRDDPEAAARAANVIATRAGGSHLVAGIAAHMLAFADAAIDPRRSRFDPRTVPGDERAAAAACLRDGHPTRRRANASLLAALAYARGPGLDDEQWLAFAHALDDRRPTEEDLGALRTSPIAECLLETARRADTNLTRLVHPRLADAVLVGRDRLADERSIAELVVRPAAPHGRAYRTAHAVDHLAAAGQLDRLDDDAALVVDVATCGDAAALAALDRSDGTAATVLVDAACYLGDDAGANAVVLEALAVARGDDGLAQRLRAVPLARSFRVRGRLRTPSRSHGRFDGHLAAVVGVATARWPGRDTPVVVTTSFDGTARVWDPDDPAVDLARFDGHTDAVVAVASVAWPDRSVLVTASFDGTARAWDPLAPTVELARFARHTDAVVSVATLPWPDRRTAVVATASSDGTARVWDPREPEVELARFDGHAGAVTGVAALATPGSPLLVTTSFDMSACVWDPRRPDRALARLVGHRAEVLGVAALGRGAEVDGGFPLVVTASADGTARVWDPRWPDRELARFDGHTDEVFGVATLAWPGRAAPVVVTSSFDGTARVWDPHAPGVELARFEAGAGPVWGVAALARPRRATGPWRPTGAAANDETIVVSSARAWRVYQRTGVLVSEPGTSFASARYVAFHVDGAVQREVARIVAVRDAVPFDDVERARLDASQDPLDRRLVGVLDVAREHGFDGGRWQVRLLTAPGERGHLTLDADVAVRATVGHDHLVLALADGTAHVWEPGDADVPPPVDLHTDAVVHVALVGATAEQASRLVTASLDGTARVWSADEPDRALAAFGGHAAPVAGAAVFPWPDVETPAVVTTSFDGTARVWDPRDPDVQLARFDGHDDAVLAATSLPVWPGRAGHVIVTVSLDGTARVWDPREPELELARFEAHTDGVTAVATLPWPDRERAVVVTASLDGTARLWDPREPEVELARFVGHDDAVTAVATLPSRDGEHTLVVTASLDGTARVWDPREPEVELARFVGHDDEVIAVATLAWPGRVDPVVVTASAATARVWDPLDPAHELARLPLLAPGRHVAAVADGIVAVATARGLVVFDVTSSASSDSLSDVRG